MTSSNTEEFEVLLAAAIEGTLKQEEVDLLLSALRDDSSLLDRFGSLVEINRLLPLALEQKPDLFAKEAVAVIASGRDSTARNAFVSGVVQKLRKQQQSKFIWKSAAAVAAAVIIIGITILFSGDQPVAQIIRNESLSAQSMESDLTVGDRVVFERGLIKLSYRTGVTVILNGPVDYEVTGSNSGYLHRGRLVAQIEGNEGKGFTIDGASGKLIDLGTAFGVAVDGSGEMEVHVLEGAVEAVSSGGKKTLLRENEAMRLMKGLAGQPERADEGAFFTQMPPESNVPPEFVRWSFNEEGGEVCEDSGASLGKGKAQAIFKVEGNQSKGPKRINGKYSGAIQLDGISYLESEFEGIKYGGPRTVAFWVRVPKDFRQKEGFGIVNWGSYEKPGSAWQVAINSLGRDGPLGRLRVGTGHAQVVGTSDLRDGEWHHCAIVLYGDPTGKPNTATHVLLYVDGMIENAARKSVRVVDTLPNNGSNSLRPGVWIGRNMAYSVNKPHSGAGLYGKYFRGDLDELIITNTALNQAEIQKLMSQNLMPES